MVVATRNIMDAHHYDKIADKLMQFRSKLPFHPHLENETAKNYVREMKEVLDIAILSKKVPHPKTFKS